MPDQSIRFFYKSTCTTCRGARSFLRGLLAERPAGTLVERDYAKKPLTVEEIKTIFGDDPLPPFLNTRHAIYKERGFAEKLPARDELTQLIIAEPNLIRRPITRRGNQVVIGFDKESLSEFAG